MMFVFYFMILMQTAKNKSDLLPIVSSTDYIRGTA